MITVVHHPPNDTREQETWVVHLLVVAEEEVEHCQPG